MEKEKLGSGTLQNWSPEEVAQGLKEKAILLIDIRTPQEHSNDRIEGALLMPMQEFDPAYLPLEGPRQIVLHCGSGVRSKKMAEKCVNAGAGIIAHLAGGMGAWKKSGQEYIAVDPATGGPRRTSQSG